MVIKQFEIRRVRYADEKEAKKILEELYTSGNVENEDSGNISIKHLQQFRNRVIGNGAFL